MLKFLHDILSFEGSRDTSRASFFCGSSLGAQYKISKIKFAISMMVGSVRCIKHNYPDHRDKSERQKRGQRHIRAGPRRRGRGTCRSAHWPAPSLTVRAGNLAGRPERYCCSIILDNWALPVSPTCHPNGQGSVRCLASRRTDPAFEPSLYQGQLPPSGNAIFQGRDKDLKTVPAIQSADCRDKMRAQIAANSVRFALNWEISVCADCVVGLVGLELPTKRLSALG